MRSGELPAYLSLNQLLNGILSHSWCYSVQIWPISQKFNLCVTDGPTDTPSYRDTRTHLKTTKTKPGRNSMVAPTHQNDLPQPWSLYGRNYLVSFRRWGIGVRRRPWLIQRGTCRPARGFDMFEPCSRFLRPNSPRVSRNGNRVKRASEGFLWCPVPRFYGPAERQNALEWSPPHRGDRWRGDGEGGRVSGWTNS